MLSDRLEIRGKQLSSFSKNRNGVYKAGQLSICVLIKSLLSGLLLFAVFPAFPAPDFAPFHMISQSTAEGECPSFEITSKFTIAYGNADFSSGPAQSGAVVTARSPRGDVVGCYVVDSSGNYGAMYIYGEDTSVTPTIPGMRIGEPVAFYLDEISAASTPTLYWQNDRDIHAIDLLASGEPAPTADFNASPTSGYQPLEVQFTDLSLGNITTWQWAFGDGGVSALRNPSHTYTQNGRFTVSLTVSGPGGQNTITRAEYIAVVSGAPEANFSGSPTSGIAPLTVSFTNLSTNYTATSWSFGDNIFSSDPAPSHIYLVKGIYTVSLLVLGPGGSDAEIKTNYIQVFEPVQAAFTSDLTSGQAPLTIQFANQSTGDWEHLLWDFGDGHTISATNPVHTYLQDGIYTVTLTASGPGGSDTSIQDSLILVNSLASIYLPIVIR